jgi:hypothetical protein
MDNLVAIRFSNEELAFLLDLLGIKTLPGLGKGMLTGVPDVQAGLMLQAGFNALRSKGWLNVAADSSPPVLIDQTVAAALMVCASAPKLMYAARLGSDGYFQPLYVYFGQHLVVAHQLIEPGVHQITIALTPDDMLRLVCETLHVRQQSAPDETIFHLSSEDFQALFQNLQTGRGESVTQIINLTPLADVLPKEFVHSIQELQSHGIISLMESPATVQAAPSVLGTVYLLEGSDRLWMLETNEKNEDVWVAITPISGEGFRVVVSRLLGA